ncbi:MAG: ABC transporter permease [Candidatus Marinimicrobia bacterium]|nr:ABC transporter permease [Candidatus Neomarinimicrobiota bacterium]
MKTAALSLRNWKEILRDKLNVSFGLGFPLVLILLLSFIQKNIPVSMFELPQLTPGIIVFGFTFLSLFSGMLIAKDRSSSLFMRLFTSPLKPNHFVFSYYIPFLPLAFFQAVFTYIVALILGLEFSIHILSSIIISLPVAIMFVSLGVLCGTIFNDKQVGGICGAFLTNFSAWLSDTWFDINLVGGAFAKIAKALPFYHAVEAGRYALAGEYSKIFPDLWWVIGYAIVISALAIWVFGKKMNYDK